VEGLDDGARKHAAMDGVARALRRQHVGKLHKRLVVWWVVVAVVLRGRQQAAKRECQCA
jgi:hypothetical protein